MDAPAGYFNWGFVSISLPNLGLMAAMIGVFVTAVLLPFPFTHDADDPELDNFQ
ncbi:MAG: hypothetical protein ACYDGR_00420 [Candidatus Dormibacteria bacterium]